MVVAIITVEIVPGPELAGRPGRANVRRLSVLVHSLTGLVLSNVPSE